MVAVCAFVGLSAQIASAGDDEKVTICHAAGLEGTTHYETLTIGYEAVYGPAGHFYENGTPRAGHEQDYLGECNPPPVDKCPNLEGNQSEIPPGYHLGEDENGRPACIKDETPPTDVCPNIEGNQDKVPEGMVKDEAGNCLVPLNAGVTFTEATCTAGPSFHLTKTNGLPFYNVEGPDFVNGLPAPGGTYTFTVIVPEGYIVQGETVFTHTYAAAPSNCGTASSPVGTASVICDSGAQLYRLSGTVDGQTADKVEPATLPGFTKGVSNVTVTRGDTSVRTTVTTLGDCAPAPPVPTVTTAATTTTTTPAAPAVTPPTTAKPKPPVRKPVAKKAKKKTTSKVVKHKANKKPHKAPKTLSLR